jgi:hypothetical protein
VCNLDLFGERDEFRGNLMKLTIPMLLHDIRKDSKNSYSRVVSRTIRKGHSIYKMKPKKRNKAYIKDLEARNAAWYKEDKLN